MKRLLVVLLVIVLVVPLALVAAASWFLNGNALKTRLADQVRRATGRELTIAGPVSLAWSLAPTITLSDVSLGNPPDFPQPHMAHVARLEASVAIGPLLQRRVVIDHVAVVSPSIRLEQNAAGRANWDFRPPPTPAASPSAPSASGERFTVAVGAVDVTDATIAWGGQSVAAPHLTYDPASGQIAGTLSTSGTGFALAGNAGPIGGAAFPVDLRLTGNGLVASMTGTSAAATLTVNAADLSALSPLVGRPLPPVHDVALSTALPGPGPLRLESGAVAVGPLSVQHAVFTAGSLSDAGAFSASASIGALPLAIDGHLGSLSALLRGAAPVDARLEASGLVATATGTLAATGAAELALTVTSPDLAATGAQAGLRLPAFRTLDAAARLSLNPAQLAVDELHVTSAQGDLGGTLTFANAARPTLRGILTSTSLDLDALRPPPAAAPAAAAPQAAPSAPQPVRVIPDTKLPLAALRDADADLQISAASLLLGGATYRSAHAHAVLQSGTLRLDPVGAAFGAPAGTATLTIEAAATPPRTRLTVEAPALPFGEILALGGTPSQSSGTLDLRADLSGTGDTVRALAATLTGHAGLAIVDGQIDNDMLERFAAGVLRTTNLPLEAGGTTTLRCVALRADAAAGVVQLGALTLDTSKLALDGGGSVTLGDEALDLHLRPQLRLGGGLSVPLRVRGTLAAPKVSLDPGALGGGRVGIVLGGGAPPDTCGPALALARDGQAGAPAAAPPATRAMKPADLLRGLLR